MGRKAATSPHFNYTQALKDSGLVWNAATLDHFLTSPMTAVPGTTMPMPVPDANTRADLIAYLATLRVPEGVDLETAAFSIRDGHQHGPERLAMGSAGCSTSLHGSRFADTVCDTIGGQFPQGCAAAGERDLVCTRRVQREAVRVGLEQSPTAAGGTQW